MANGYFVMDLEHRVVLPARWTAADVRRLALNCVQERLAGEWIDGQRYWNVGKLARQLAIDLWRIRTGQLTPEALGLI